MPETSEQKKITILVHTVSLGGVKRHIRDIFLRLDSRRFRVAGAFPREQLNPAYMSGTNSDYLTFFSEAGLESYVVETPVGIRPWYILTAAWRLFRLLREVQPDVLHTHSTMGGVVGRLAMFLWRPALSVYTPHLPYFALQTGWRRWVAERIERLLFQGYDTLVAVSRSEYDDLAALFGDSVVLAQINQSMPVDLVADPVAHNSDELRLSLGISSESKIILSTARFDKQKDVKTLIEAAALLRNARSDFVVLLAGEGPQRRELEDLVLSCKMEKQFFFLGWRDDIRELINLSDIVVLSTKREGLPFALLEAMALKKPVIGSDVPGVRECIVHGSTGFLFPGGNARALAEYVAKLLDNLDLAREMGGRGREFCLRTFSPFGMIQGLEKIYEQVFDRGRK